MSKYGYPSHLVSNAEKGKNWILKYCKAAYKEYNSQTGKIFYGNRFNYATIRDYAMGTQSISKYKKMLDVSESANDSWLNIDWSVLPIVPRFRRLALSKVAKRSYNVVCTPIDTMSEQEITRHKKEQEIKIKTREQLATQDPMLSKTPILMREDGEPEDMEELELMMAFTYKHKMAEQMEEIISSVLHLNGYDEIRKQIIQDCFDYGVCGIREFVDNGRIKVRKVYPENIVTSYARRRDFADVQHVGEITLMSIADIKSMAGSDLSEEQYIDIAERYINKYNNPSAVPPQRGIGADYETFKIPVLDMEFFSVNNLDVESRIDKRGNKITRVYKKAKKRKSNNYSTTSYKVVYKAMWILDTEYLFNYGLQTNMKRKKTSLTDTTLSYHLFAPEFNDMRASSIMEQVIPIADSIQLNWFKLQNAIATSRPKGIQIALDAIENIPLGGGGTEMTPKDVLDLFNKKGTLVYRYLDPSGNPSPYKPIEEIENGLGRDVVTYFNLIKENIQLIRDITGVNEYVDGSTVDPKTLSNVTRLAEEASTNSLYGIVEADRFLLEAIADDIVVRAQDLKKQGLLSKAYSKTLGVETIKYLGQQDSFSAREFGIKLEDRPDDIQKERLLQMASQYAMNGLIDLEDMVLIENTDNLKKAQYILAYRYKKRKKEKQQEAMMQQQSNAQVQQQSAAQAAQMQQQVEMQKQQFEIQMAQLKGELQMQLETLKSELKAKSE